MVLMCRNMLQVAVCVKVLSLTLYLVCIAVALYFTLLRGFALVTR